MTRQLSMSTRRELIKAVGVRYRQSDRPGKKQILTEFLELTGYHRRHATRVLSQEPTPTRAKPGPRGRYSEEMRGSANRPWEVVDRICGKRLQAIIPALIKSMTRHGHLSLSDEIREMLISARPASIDPAAQRCSWPSIRRQAEAQRRRWQCNQTRSSDSNFRRL